MELQRAWSNLGRLLLTDAAHLGWPDRHEARAALREARVCAEQIRGLFLDPKDRQRAQEEAIAVYDLLVQTCVEIWQVYADLNALRKAVEVAESSRARNLMEMLADEVFQPRDAPAGLTEDFRALRKRLRQARQRRQDEESRPDSLAAHARPAAAPPGKPGGATGTAPARRDVDLLQALDRLAHLRQEIDNLEQQETRLLANIR